MFTAVLIMSSKRDLFFALAGLAVLPRIVWMSLMSNVWSRVRVLFALTVAG